MKFHSMRSQIKRYYFLRLNTVFLQIVENFTSFSSIPFSNNSPVDVQIIFFYLGSIFSEKSVFKASLKHFLGYYLINKQTQKPSKLSLSHIKTVHVATQKLGWLRTCLM